MHDLFGLIWILLASHQSLSCINLSKKAFSRDDRDDCRSIKKVSSAKKRSVLLMAFGKLLIYIRKSKGPSMEPWGIPILMGLVEDEVLLKVTNWFLEVR